MSLKRDLRNKRFWRRFVTQGLAALGLLSAALSLIDLFWPDQLSRLSLPAILIVLVVALAFAIVRSWPYPVEQHYAMPDTKVRLVTGDLFGQNTNLVIGMADTFDIATPHIIAAGSVQGQFLDRVYKHDLKKLKQDLKAALSDKQVVGKVTKPGNTNRYPMGTVATISQQRTHYFCVAYTRLDENNKASSTIGELWHALENLWDEVRVLSNGEVVSAPVIGLGQSGMSTVLPIQDAVRFLILSFMFASRGQRVCDELRIVIRPQDEKRVDMLELQDFLTSLRSS